MESAKSSYSKIFIAKDKNNEEIIIKINNSLEEEIGDYDEDSE